jgi:uncharacterized damage-inducible protein DinB
VSLIRYYIESIQRVDRIIKNKTEGLTHADSMKQLPFPGNCMNWNLGHILVYRMQFLGVIDGVSQADPSEVAVYGGGSPPLTDSANAIPLPTLLERLDDASARVIAALRAMPPEKLDAWYDKENGVTVADRLMFYLVYHETFHAGQLEPLRELGLAGK